MQDYPHHYVVSADAQAEGPVGVNSEGVETLATTSPPQFGGPEGYWSPETMLVASVAKKTRFTEYHLKVTLHLPALSNEVKARRILEKANSNCLVTNSLNGTEYVDAMVIIADT